MELTWLGKDKQPQLEPRILIEDSSKSYGVKNAESMLIHGDNLLALKALEQDFAGKIKCIYIDPPYNTGNAFEKYDDSVEHSTWLSLMRDRLLGLRRLLAPDGFICCHIDDSEGHYLKVLMDEIFGRRNYMTTLYVQVRYAQKTLKQDMSFHKQIEYIHIYRKAFGATPCLPTQEFSFDKFNFYIEELTPGCDIELGGKRVQVFHKGQYKVTKGPSSREGLKEIWASGTILDGNSSGRFFRDFLTGRVSSDGLGVLYKVDGIGGDGLGYRYFTGPKRASATKGKYYQGVPTTKRDEAQQVTQPIDNFYDLAASFGNCRHEGGVEFRSGKKPEALLHIILARFSKPGDWVLDSFLGSGSTAAVAHKMSRQWIGIELGNHCAELALPRLRAICDGKDETGISQDAEWKGGGGFKYYELAPSLLKQDPHGNWIFSDEYNSDMLGAAMAKHESFKYCPDTETYWKQGQSSEKDFIFTTTSFVQVAFIDRIHEEMQTDEHLLICCKKFSAACSNRYPNIEIKKIPKMLLGKCEFGREDYSLNIVNMPTDEDEPDFVPAGPPKPKQKKGRANPAQPDLFSTEEVS
ncbi:site-specific DNA-methyltransferase [Verrucomicrobiota bacterium]